MEKKEGSDINKFNRGKQIITESIYGTIVNSGYLQEAEKQKSISHEEESTGPIQGSTLL